MPRIVVTGIKDIDAKFKRLGDPKVVRRITSTSMRIGLKPILSEVKIEAPEGETRVLIESLKLRTAKRSRKNKGAIVFVVISIPKPGQKFYALFVDRGTKTKTGAVKMAARPFMENVFARSAESAKSITIREMKERLDQEVKK